MANLPTTRNSKVLFCFPVPEESKEMQECEE
jgi:hypothetical protein